MKVMTLEIIGLLRQIEKGDETALAVLFTQYSKRVYSMVYHVLKNDILAQEVTQDTFLKIWKNPQAWDKSKGQFDSWLLTLARYTAIDRLRHEVRKTGKNTPLNEDIIVDHNQDDIEYIDSNQLQTVLTQLPSEQRVLIELAYFKGMKHGELAQTLDLPLGTVKTRLRLGLQKLRHLLKDKS